MPPIAPRLIELLDVRDGWYGLGEESKAPTPAFIVWAGTTLATLVERAGVPEPFIYPLPDGGASVKWEGEGPDLELLPDRTIRVVGWDDVDEPTADFDWVVSKLGGPKNKDNMDAGRIDDATIARYADGLQRDVRNLHRYEFLDGHMDALRWHLRRVADDNRPAFAIEVDRLTHDTRYLTAVLTGTTPVPATNEPKGLTIKELQAQAYTAAKEKGFHDEDEAPPSPVRQVAWMGLLCSEAAEAIECIRNNEPLVHYREDGKPEGLGAELADVVIRVADSAGALGIDLERCVLEKLAYNRKRPHKHGGKAV